MKKLLIILSAIFFAFSGNAQAPDKINFQAVLNDAGNNLIPNQSVALQFSLIQDSLSGTLVYKETHALSSNDYGIVNLKIGDGNVVSGNFSDIDWSTGSYFLETAIDFTGGTNYGFMGVSQLLNVPYSLNTPQAGFAEIADYDSLSNRPMIITAEQASKLDLITISESVNLDTMRRDTDTNLTKIAFPGFGTTAGTAYEVLWTEIADSAYLPSGNIGMGLDSSTSFWGSALHVGGGILQRGIPSDSAAGLMYYDSSAVSIAGPGLYFYYDGALGKQTFNVEHSVLYQMYFIDSTASISDIVLLQDLIIQNRLGTGSGATPGYDFNENDVAMIDSIIRLYFWDTSSSAAFPSGDWKIQINDAGDEGSDYFSIVAAAGMEPAPFKVMASAPDNSFFLAGNGDIGIGTGIPGVALDVTGNVTADSLIGNASGMSGLPAGGSSTQNTGSTTLGADSDNDSNGELIFETRNLSRLVVSNNGNVGVGTPTPEEMLEVTGTLSMTNIKIAGNLSVAGSLAGSLFYDPAEGTMSLDYDVTGKNKIFFNSASGIVTISGFINGVIGQKVTLINLSSANTLNLSRFSNTMRFPSYPNPTPISLPQYGTASFVFDGNFWNCTDEIHL